MGVRVDLISVAARNTIVQRDDGGCTCRSTLSRTQRCSTERPRGAYVWGGEDDRTGRHSTGVLGGCCRPRSAHSSHRPRAWSKQTKARPAASTHSRRRWPPSRRQTRRSPPRSRPSSRTTPNSKPTGAVAGLSLPCITNRAGNCSWGLLAAPPHTHRGPAPGAGMAPTSRPALVVCCPCTCTSTCTCTYI